MLVNHSLITFIACVVVLVLAIDAIGAVVQTIAMTPFTAVKTVLGDYLCAIYPVAMTTILSILALQCSYECRRVNSCGGFNFRDNGNICEQISASNVTFGVKQDCKYFILGIGTVPTGQYGTDVALNAPATQYSLYVTGYEASKAVDGSRSTESCTNSGGGIYYWWTVHLGSPRHVNVVQLASRVNAGQPQRLDNFYVWLSNTQPTVGQPLNITECIRSVSSSRVAFQITFQSSYHAQQFYHHSDTSSYRVR